jgi:general secretion pathway protein G
MHQQRTSTSRRAGFTLVELMVVILIISILSALLTMAVSRGISTAKRARNRTEIAQIAAAVDAFKAFYKVDYIPSKIYLSESGNGYLDANRNQITSGFIGESISYLQRLWPKLSPGAPGRWGANNYIDWNGSGKPEGVVSNPDINNPAGEMILEGDQCLVFFLGGIPLRDPVTLAWSCTGFSTNPIDPAAQILSGGNVKGPMYEFDASRLAYFQHATEPKARIPSYLDTYGTSDGKGALLSGAPYAYFSSFGIRNGYNRYGAGDCLKLGVNPYAQATTQYINPSGFQIISAGADLKFGPGSNPGASPIPLWTPATAATSAASGPNGADDQSNFYDSLLGTPSIN